MAYAALEDLSRLAGMPRLVELTDRGVPPTGEVDQAVAARALEDASALIDGYLAARYPVPVAPVPEILRRQCAVIAYHLLHVEQAPNKVVADWRAAVRWLERLAEGRITLTVGEGATVAASGAGRRFTRDSLGRF